MLSSYRPGLILPVFAALTLPLLVSSAAWSQSAAATYQFGSTLAAVEVSAPALTATNPQGTSGFGTDTVFGTSKTVYNFVGTSANAQQAGLTLNTASLIAPTSYTVEMVFKFTGNTGAWRRIIDVENRQSDSGFYVDPSNALAVYPVIGSANSFATNTYYHVTLAVGGGNVSAYLNGASAFSTTTTLLNINNSNNPSSLMNFFLDNTAGGGQGEYSSGSISLLRVYNSTLTAPQVAAKYNEVVNGVTVPETGALALVGAASLPMAGLVLRRRLAKRA